MTIYMYNFVIMCAKMDLSYMWSLCVCVYLCVGDGDCQVPLHLSHLLLGAELQLAERLQDLIVALLQLKHIALELLQLGLRYIQYGGGSIPLIYLRTRAWLNRRHTGHQ